jgi:hypothetical protein
VASASGQRGSDRLHHWEAVQVLCRAAAPVLWFDEQRRHAHRLRGLRGRSPDTGTAVEQRFLGRQIQLVDQPVHRRTAIDPQQPSRTRRTHRRACPDCAPKKSQTQITALGNLPNAVIPDAVTSSVGQDVLSGIVRPLRLAFLLLDVRQFLYPVGRCALAGSVAVF